MLPLTNAVGINCRMRSARSWSVTVIPSCLASMRQFFLENELIQNLLRIQRFQSRRDRAGALNARQLGANIRHANGLIVHGRNHISGSDSIGALSRHQIKQHAHAEQSDDDAEHDSHAQLFLMH